MPPAPTAHPHPRPRPPQVVIPLPGSAGGHAPTVNSCDGDWRYDSRRGALVWSVELVDASNGSGALEFVTPAADSDAFFPIEASLY